MDKNEHEINRNGPTPRKQKIENWKKNFIDWDLVGEFEENAVSPVNKTTNSPPKPKAIKKSYYDIWDIEAYEDINPSTSQYVFAKNELPQTNSRNSSNFNQYRNLRNNGHIYESDDELGLSNKTYQNKKTSYDIWEMEKNNTPIPVRRPQLFDESLYEQKRTTPHYFSEQHRKCDLRYTEQKIEEMKKNDEGNDKNVDLLPRLASIYDYTTQPISVREIRRKYLPNVNIVDPPFLRPIIIDGVGLLKAYINCCPPKSNKNYLPFPLIPFIRCLFYWISKGHKTLLCFPKDYNPITNSCFYATREDSNTLELLFKNKMALFFKPKESNKAWYFKIKFLIIRFQDKLADDRACLITTVTQWRYHMPNYLQSGILKPTVQNDGTKTYKNNYNRNERCERLLQPFFSHEGKWIFFSSFNSSNVMVSDIIEEKSVLNEEEYNKLYDLQLGFIEQAKQLKILHDFLPVDSRFRETSVMVKIVERLKDFFPS